MYVPAQATAGVGLRFLAHLIDGLLIGLPFCPVLFLVVLGSDPDSALLDGVSLLFNCVYVIVWSAYQIMMEALRGTTVGKMALGLKVVKVDGTRMDWQAAMVRNVTRIIEGNPVFFPTYLLGAILVWTSPTKQRLGDKVAKTLVVKKDQVVGVASPMARF